MRKEMAFGDFTLNQLVRYCRNMDCEICILPHCVKRLKNSAYLNKQLSKVIIDVGGKGE